MSTECTLAWAGLEMAGSRWLREVMAKKAPLSSLHSLGLGAAVCVQVVPAQQATSLLGHRSTMPQAFVREIPGPHTPHTLRERGGGGGKGEVCRFDKSESDRSVLTAHAQHPCLENQLDEIG